MLSMNPDSPELTRRRALAVGATVIGTGLLSTNTRADDHGSAEHKGFRFGLNTSTIRGQDLSVEQEVDVAGRAGYDGLEPWLGKLNAFIEGGGSLKDLRKRIEDNGLTIESAIGFASWIVNDEAKRKQGLEQAKRDMDLIARLGGKRIAAPPAGVSGEETVSLDDAAERYRVLLEIGDEIGVTPQIEMWGGNRTIGTVSKAIYVAVRAGHPKACFLGDVYHTYKGGSSFDGLRMLGGNALQVYHFNDYPANPPREKIGDADRVHVGDGIAPIRKILEIFLSVGATPVLSLELFNREYWKQDANDVAKVGLEKMKAAVAAL